MFLNCIQILTEIEFHILSLTKFILCYQYGYILEFNYTTYLSFSHTNITHFCHKKMVFLLLVRKVSIRKKEGKQSQQKKRTEKFSLKGFYSLHCTFVLNSMSIGLQSWIQYIYKQMLLVLDAQKKRKRKIKRTPPC